MADGTGTCSQALPREAGGTSHGQAASLCVRVPRGPGTMALDALKSSSMGPELPFGGLRWLNKTNKILK